jgi:uncharacterized protein (DUF433 family)
MSTEVLRTQQSWIEKTPGVCGGSAYIRTTRIPVWLLAAWRKDGLTNARILTHHPCLSDDDLKAAWRYYETNAAEIDEEIKHNEEA